MLGRELVHRRAGNIASRMPYRNGLVAWYRFNTGITSSGSLVSQWADQSGNGNHLLQGTDANRPIDGNVGTDLVSSPTVNSGWTDNMDGTYTHANGGGTDSIVETNLDGDTTYLTVLIVTSTTQGSVRMDLTGDFGTSRTANGTYTEVGTTSSGGAGTKAYAIVPSNDFDGTVQFTVQEITQDGSIFFNGVDQFLKATFTLVRPYSIYALLRQVSFTDNDMIWDGATNSSFLLQQRITTPDVRLADGTSGTAASSDLLIGTYGVAFGSQSGTDAVLQIDNNTPITATMGGNDMDGFTLGARGSAAQFSHIQVKEVIIYSAAHGARHRKHMYEYLRNPNA